MRFEVYARNNFEDNNLRLVLLTNNREDIYYRTKKSLLSSTEHYIILDNTTPYPLNYTELGFNTPPSEAECYALIYNCKVAKHTTISLPKENFVRFYNFAMELTLYETLIFFQIK